MKYAFETVVSNWNISTSTENQTSLILSSRTHSIGVLDTIIYHKGLVKDDSIPKQHYSLAQRLM